MSTHVQGTMTYEADCRTVFAMLRDPEYIAAKLKGTGGSDPDVTVTDEGSDVVIVADRTLPAQIPAFARRFTGDTIRVHEVDTWSPADELGGRTGRAELDFLHTPASATGTLSLQPVPGGCEMLIDLHVNAAIPLVGGKIAGEIAHQITRAIRQENKIGVQWLTDHPQLAQLADGQAADKRNADGLDEQPGD